MLDARVFLLDLQAQQAELLLGVGEDRESLGQHTRLVFLRVERAPCSLERSARVAGRERVGEPRSGLLPRSRSTTEDLDDVRQALLPERFAHGIDGMREARHLAPQRRSRLDAVVEDAGLVGRLELDAAPPCRGEPLAQLRATAPRGHRVVVLAKTRVADDACVERAKHRRAVVVELLDQLHVGRETKAIEERQRRGAQQLREPGVEGADLDRPPGGEDPAVERGEVVCERLGATGRDAAVDERGDALGVARMRR
jgi:hypothetical protein